MITGFNTDVTHRERVFHIQTEDKGLSNPMVESLIYCGGEIVASRRNSYSELTEEGSYTEEEVHRRMEDQHKAMIREIANGRFDTDEPMPFGHNLVSNRSLDEVVLRFLAEFHGEAPEPEPATNQQATVVVEAPHEISTLELVPVDDQVLYEGTRPSVRLTVREGSGTTPVRGAHVVVTLISTENDPSEVFSSTTDDDGFVEASFDLPELDNGNQAIVVSAELGAAKAEIRQLIEKPKRPSVKSP